MKTAVSGSSSPEMRKRYPHSAWWRHDLKAAINDVPSPNVLASQRVMARSVSRDSSPGRRLDFGRASGSAIKVLLTDQLCYRSHERYRRINHDTTAIAINFDQGKKFVAWFRRKINGLVIIKNLRSLEITPELLRCRTGRGESFGIPSPLQEGSFGSSTAMDPLTARVCAL